MTKVSILADNDFDFQIKCHIIFTADKAQNDFISF